MKLGRLLPGLGAAGLAVLVSVPVGAGTASAAPAPPPAYTALARAYPLSWSAGGLPVGDLRVPYVSGLTNNVGVADADAVLTKADLNTTAMSGEEIKGLTCTGFDEAKCNDPFIPDAKADRLSTDAPRVERIASWAGRDDKFPGRIRSLVECGADCAKDVTRSSAEAAGASGGVPTYFTIGGSSAGQDLSLDDRGRLVSLARSSLSDVVIGANSEIRFSNLTTTATAFGSGADNAKDGRADVRVENLFILDNPVELTRAGLRLANGGASEQEAYDGAKALLQKLKERGITLTPPDFNAQVDRKPDHATVQFQGLRVHFDQSVQGPQGVQTQGVAHDLDLGNVTALVAAFERAGKIEVSKDGAPVFESSDLQPSTSGPAPAPNARVGKNHSAHDNRSAPGRGGLPVTFVPTPATSAAGDQAPVAQPQPPASPPDTALSGQEANGPDDLAFKAPDITRALGLRGAHAVSHAFGAFLGLGLILPVARLIIRRFG